MPEEEIVTKNSDSWLLEALIACSIFAILASFYSFYYKKDYDFIVEVKCDATKEVCFQRDCTNEDDCPPNGLSSFKRYSLKAKDFKMCNNEDCNTACETGVIECDQIECTENLDTGESCSVPEGSPDSSPQ